MAQNWFQHTLSQRRFQTRNQAATLAILGAAILLILGTLYLSQVAAFATTNRIIEDLISQRDRLRRTNEQLIGEIASLRTVPRLFTRAQEIGFRPATNADIDYLVIAGYNPDSERTTALVDSANTDSAAEIAAVYDETFSGWLEQQLALLRDQFEAFGG